MSEFVKKKIDTKKLLTSMFTLFGLVFVIVFFGVMTKGNLFSVRSLNSMLNDGIYIFIGAVAYSFIMAQGQIDFSIGAVMAVTCGIAGVAAKALSPALALPAALAVGAVIGLINALVIVKLRINSFVTTLAMQFICNGLVLVVLNNSILSAPLSMLSWYSMPLKVILIAAFFVVGYFVFEKTYYGKTCKAVGASPEAARQSGVNVTLIQMLPFIIMGITAGLLGFISLIRTGTASSQSGASLMMNVLNALLVGGIPFTGGTNARFRSIVIGTLTMTVLTCGMTLLSVDSVMQQLVKGLVFLVAVSISYDRSNVKVIK